MNELCQQVQLAASCPRNSKFEDFSQEYRMYRDRFHHETKFLLIRATRTTGEVHKDPKSVGLVSQSLRKTLTNLEICTLNTGFDACLLTSQKGVGFRENDTGIGSTSILFGCLKMKGKKSVSILWAPMSNALTPGIVQSSFAFAGRSPKTIGRVLH